MSVTTESESSDRYGHHGVLNPAKVGIDRAVTRRAEHITGTTDLESKHARAVAWAEMGFSVPKAMDTSRGTAKLYLGRVRAQYGDCCTYHTHPEDRGDLSEVTPPGLSDAPDDVRVQFLESAREHPDVVPDAVREAFAEAIEGDDSQ